MSEQTQPGTALQSLAEKLRTDAIAIFGEGQAERDIIEWFYGALLAAQPVSVVPDGLPMLISGAVFDFAGYLTTRDKVIEVGATANASPIADLVKEWAELRGLSIVDAAVLSWQYMLAAAPAQGQQVGQEPVYVECRECAGCGHVGINDSLETHSACDRCAWIGPSPTKDKCPGCASENTMSAACPKCGCIYRLLADAEITAPQPAPAQDVAGKVIAEHSGCGYGIQVDQLTVRLYRGDKVIMVRGPLGAAHDKQSGGE